MAFKNDELVYPSKDPGRAGSKAFFDANNHSATGLVSGASELIDRYLRNAEAIITLNESDVELSVANELLASAEKSIVDFNKTDNTETKLKNIILACGAFEASNAAYYFETLFEDYRIRIGDDKYFRELDIDSVEKYVALQREVHESSYHMLYDLVKATSKNDYTQKHTKESHKNDSNYKEDYRDVAIKDHGLQIYHLTMLVDFCNAIKRGIKKWNSKTADDTLLVEKINQFSKLADGRCRSLTIFYDECCKSDPYNMTDEEVIEAFTRVRNMFDAYLTALLYTEYGNISNIEELEFKDKLDKIIEDHKSDASRALTEFEDSLIAIDAVAERRNRIYIEKNIKIISYIDRAMDIANAIKNELGRNTFTDMQPKEE